MKMRNLLPLTALVALPIAFIASAVTASAEVALVEVRFGKEKQTKRIVIDLAEGQAPATVENFKKLARKRFYKNITFHRAVPGYMIQAGDPQSRGKDRSRVGTGGPGYTIPAEIRSGMPAGSVAMGRLPDKINPTKASNGSQFFIVLQDAPELSGQYTVFGKVIEGLEVADSISRQSSDSNDNPVERISIRSVKIAPSAPALPAPKEPKKKKAQ